MNTKILILALMFVLLIPLNIAANNLTVDGKHEIKTSSIIVTISTTSDWAVVSFNGASVQKYEILDKADGLMVPIMDSSEIMISKYKNDGIPETIRLKLELRIFYENVELGITKDYTGEASVTIDKTGEYRNNKKPLQVPVTIETTSDWTKIDLDGATIRNAAILDIKGIAMREPIIGTKSITLAKVGVNDTSYGSARFLIDMSLDTPMPGITLEKADNGMTRVIIGELTLENNQTAASVLLRNIPLIIETTSNKTQIEFQGLYLRKVNPVEVNGQNLTDSMIEENSILLNYSHSGDSYRKARYLVDLGVTDAPSNIIITKNDPGYAVVGLATYDFASIGKSTNGSVSYPLDTKHLSSAIEGDMVSFDRTKEKKYEEKTIPLHIETTSDWTDITLKDMTITSAEIKSISGNIEKPTIGGNTILIKKLVTYDKSFSSVDLLLHVHLSKNFNDLHESTMTITVSRGDIGSTTVQTSKMLRLVNAEKAKNDPSNTKIYEIPLDTILVDNKNQGDISYNPVAYTIPLFKELSEQNMELIDTQEMRSTYLIDANMFPGMNKINMNLRESEAVGLLSAVALSQLILFILGMYTLSKEGFFNFIPRLLGKDKITIRTMGGLAIELFEKTPASSLFILEALIVLVITPFILLLNRTFAEVSAILAYFLLVFGVSLRLVGQSERVKRIFQFQDFSVIMFLIKTASIIMMLSSLVAAGFELIGFYGAIAAFILGLLFVFLILRYLKKHFGTGSYATEW
ncbi:MAG: hypothetical protein OIN66_08955 [Candidatus Methanoperedens sp.]|nr:hypothetical protein [Candidatus Methanoperedens sp.]